MPIREFKCSAGHVTEKILNGEADRTTEGISCGELVIYTDVHLPCRLYAERVKWSRVAPAQFIEGNGGFYSPTVGAKPFTTHNTSSMNEFIKENKLTKGLARKAKSALSGGQ